MNTEKKNRAECEKNIRTQGKLGNLKKNKIMRD